MLDVLHPERIRGCRLSCTERRVTGRTQTKRSSSIAEQRGQEQEAAQRMHEKNDDSSVDRNDLARQVF